VKKSADARCEAFTVLEIRVLPGCDAVSEGLAASIFTSPWRWWQQGITTQKNRADVSQLQRSVRVSYHTCQGSAAVHTSNFMCCSFSQNNFTIMGL